MKRLAAGLLCAWLAAPLLAQNAANAPVDDQIDSPMEYYFGALALTALVMTWLWLWLKAKKPLEIPRPLPENDETENA